MTDTTTDLLGGRMTPTSLSAMLAPMPAKRTPKAPEPHPGFRKLKLTALIQVDPKRAAEEILAAYRVAGASLKAAAEILGCTERTLHRWVDALDMREALEAATRKAVREGWLNKARRPRKD